MSMPSKPIPGHPYPRFLLHVLQAFREESNFGLAAVVSESSLGATKSSA